MTDTHTCIHTRARVIRGSFVEHNGSIVELDGSYNVGPKVVGSVPAGRSFLQAAAQVIRKRYIDATATPTLGPESQDETRIDFSVLVLLHSRS